MLCPLAVQQTHVSERNSQTLHVLISVEKAQKFEWTSDKEAEGEEENGAKEREQNREGERADVGSSRANGLALDNRKKLKMHETRSFVKRC